MPAAEVVERLPMVRSRLLETVGSRLAQLQPQLRQAGGNPAAKEEARRVRAALVYARRLLENACSFHVNWGRLLGALSAGYTERGDPASALRQGRIRLQV